MLLNSNQDPTEDSVASLEATEKESVFKKLRPSKHRYSLRDEL